MDMAIVSGVGETAPVVPSDIAPAAPKLLCRRIADDDLDGVVALLTNGFPERTADYWRRGLQRMRDRPSPDGCPRFGYLMTDRGRAVGVILLIFAEADDGNIRCNVSSWYVEPAYRGFSHMLLAIPLRRAGVTFYNISPAPHTIETIAAQGFSRYVGGTFHAVAALGPRVGGIAIRRVKPDTADASALLRRHAGYGCLCFEVRHRGEFHRFIFVRSWLSRGRIPCAQLVYASDEAAFVRFAGPLGRRLLRHGLASVTLDANAAIAGLYGRYAPDRRVKYFRGATPPRFNDLRDSELVVFGP